MKRLLLALACLAYAIPTSAQLTPVGPDINLPPAGCYQINSDTFLCRSIAGVFVVGNSPTGTNGIGSTSTDALILQNTTSSTAATTVQISPRMKWCGTAWNSSAVASETDCFFAENLPATVAGTTTATLKIGFINNVGTVTYPYTLTSGGTLTASGSLIAGGTLQLFNASRMGASADKLLQINDSGNTTGIELNGGSATLGTCTGGTITAGSHNIAGGYTGNTSSSCVVNFGTPNWTNAPFCVAMSIASTTHPRVSAVSTSSMTVTGGVSGEAITYLCMGRIGT